MPDFALALEDVSLLLLWAVEFALATLAFYIAKGIAAPFDAIDILGQKPFHFIAVGIENGIVGPLDTLRKAGEAGIAKGFSGLLASLELIVGVTLLLGLGIFDALTYLWKHALVPLVQLYLTPVRLVADAAKALVSTLTTTVAHDAARLEAAISSQASTTLKDARSYAESVATGAEHAAERYADTAIASLRSAEDAAVASVVKIANDAKAAGLAAAASAERTAESVAATALAEAEGAASSALAEVKAIAIGATSDLTDFEAYIKSLSIPAALTGSVALATLLTLVLSETGLENQSCRSKVKNICGTDPAAWANLLGGLAAIGFAFSLKDLYGVAEGLVGDLSAVIKEAA